MSPEEAPVDTVIQIGTSGHFARKANDGKWYTLVTGLHEVDYDDLHKVGHAIYIPKG